MDESHRYRADAGMKVINELNPILGLELNATPQVERGSKTVPFKNVVYRYPIAAAIRDGFVKEPAFATRKDFDPKSFNRDSLERLKLEDGIRNAYCSPHFSIPQPRKPLILIVILKKLHVRE